MGLSYNFFASKICYYRILEHKIQVFPLFITANLQLDFLYHFDERFTCKTSFCLWFRHARSQSCPFCRDSLKRVNSGDLWIYTSNSEIDDLASITKDNLKRLFMYIEKLPLIVPDPIFLSYPIRWWESPSKEAGLNLNLKFVYGSHFV